MCGVLRVQEVVAVVLQILFTLMAYWSIKSIIFGPKLSDEAFSIPMMSRPFRLSWAGNPSREMIV